MRVAAPGKLLLSGAYAVLEGAPAIVCAVNRFAYAHDSEGESTLEAREALAGDAPAVDVASLTQDGKKLGLGSSAAAVVAAIAFRAAERGEDIESTAARNAIFEAARAAHARVQSGGSGVDIAASTFGGVLRFTTRGHEPAALPHGVELAAFFSGTSIRTSDLRAKVDALRTRDAPTHAARMAALSETAHAASRAAESRADPRAFIAAIDASGPALSALGDAADAPIFAPPWSALAEIARAESAAFVPSGAGGGDVFVFVGTAAPSASFMERAHKAGMTPLALGIDSRGVHVAQAGKKE